MRSVLAGSGSSWVTVMIENIVSMHDGVGLTAGTGDVGET